ncbi:MAG: hypothetical protein SFZ24_07520 [Planctomycetota bacterium]|nr:hypothetical protein [Planctomycetota bacterium]
MLSLLALAQAAWAGGQCFFWNTPARVWQEGMCLNDDCEDELDSDEPYPYLVLIFKGGTLDSWMDFRSESSAKSYIKIWEKFDNQIWPRFCKCVPPNQYRYEGPYVKCRDLSSRGAKPALVRSVQALVAKWDAMALAAADRARAWARKQTEPMREFLEKLQRAYDTYKEFRDALQSIGEDAEIEDYQRVEDALEELQSLGDQLTEARADLAAAGVRNLPEIPSDDLYPKIPLRWIGTWNGTFTSEGVTGPAIIKISASGRIEFTVRYRVLNKQVREKHVGSIRVEADGHSYVAEVTGGDGSFIESLVIRGSIDADPRVMLGNFEFDSYVEDEGIRHYVGSFEMTR